MMTPGTTFHGDPVETTYSTDPGIPLGTKRYYEHPVYGPQMLRFIQNKSGGSLTRGLGVMQEDGTDKYEANLSGANCERIRFLGVGMTDKNGSGVTIASTYYGWVVCDGMVPCVSDGSTTANTAQQCAASGQFTDGVVGTDELVVWAMATEDPAGAGGFFLGRVVS